MATQVASFPDRLVLTENQFGHLQELAQEQNLSISEALVQAIELTRVVRRETSDPKTKVLFKNGNRYKQLTGWR